VFLTVSIAGCGVTTTGQYCYTSGLLFLCLTLYTQTPMTGGHRRAVAAAIAIILALRVIRGAVHIKAHNTYNRNSKANSLV
jgi:hypothetical protein